MDVTGQASWRHLLNGNMMQLLSVLELEFLCKLQMECAIENWRKKLVMSIYSPFFNPPGHHLHSCYMEGQCRDIAGQKAWYTRLWCSDVTAVLGTEVVWGTDSVGLGAGNMTRGNIYFALFWASPFRTSIWASGWTPKFFRPSISFHCIHIKPTLSLCLWPHKWYWMKNQLKLKAH